MTRAINKSLAILLLLATAARATEVPKSIGESVRFSRMGEAKGLLSEQRFVEALYLAMNALGVADKPAPRVLVVHVDDYFAKWGGADGNLKMALWTPSDCKPSEEAAKHCAGQNFYELWIQGEFDNLRMAAAVSNIVAHAYDKNDEEKKLATHRVNVELGSTVEVGKK